MTAKLLFVVPSLIVMFALGIIVGIRLKMIDCDHLEDKIDDLEKEKILNKNNQNLC